MNIVADENIPFVEEFFGHLGEITRLPGRQMSAKQLRNAEVLLVRSVTPVNAALLAESQVKFVGTCTIGMDHLDLPYLTEQSIGVSNAPGCNANSVVEYVYAALCHLNVNWQNKTVGIIGCGNVGGLLHKRLTAQGVDCRCYDPFLNAGQNADLCTLEEVLQSDIISLHTPLTTTGPHPSYHLLGSAELSQLKTGAILLNAGRGAVVDNQALLALLNARNDLHIILDVWEPEPNISQALLQKVNIGTPHIAGYSFDGKIKGTAMIYEAYCEYAGITPSVSLASVVPAVADSQRSLIASDDWACVKALIAQTYSIVDDDKRLRALLQTADNKNTDFGAGFDLLRKQYPIRREFFNYQVRNENASLLEKISALGFRV